MKNSLIFFMLLAVLNGRALADSSLNMKPAKCVTLNQGNTCYQDVKLSWKAPQKGHYCLINSHNAKQIQCWNKKKKGDYKFEFRGKQSVNYQLIKMPDKIPMAEQYFSVKWVYKARSNNRWRLF